MIQRRNHEFRSKVYSIVFESDTRAGRLFDLILLWLIVISILSVFMESVASFREKYLLQIHIVEWIFTILFSLEYAARLYCAQNRKKYATSFFGVIDLLAVLPTYLALFFPELHALIDVRVLRLIRIFRVFKLTAYMQEYSHLASALSASRKKILVFLSFV